MQATLAYVGRGGGRSVRLRIERTEDQGNTVFWSLDLPLEA